MTFVDGDLYERSFETPAGRIDVLAEIVIRGARIELRDIAVYPSGSGRLTVRPGDLLAWARVALAELAAAGFDEVQVTGPRLSGAGPGRTVNLVIRLREEQS